MLPKQIQQKPQFHTQNKTFAKYCKRKELSKEADTDDKQNLQCSSNLQHLRVDICKKIRKRSPRKLHFNTNVKSNTMVDNKGFRYLSKDIERLNGHIVYRQSELDLQKQLSSMVQSQRIDNDVDTDEQQIQSGIAKLTNFLRQACMMRKYESMDDYE